MRLAVSLLMMAGAQGVVAFGAVANEANLAGQEAFNRLASSYALAYHDLELPPLNHDYRAGLSRLESAEALSRQATVLESFQERFDTLDPAALSLCQNLDMAKAGHQIRTGINRARLGLRYLEAADGQAHPAGISSHPLGEEWYRLYLEQWLGMAVEPNDIFTFGRQQIARARDAHARLVAGLGFTGDDAGLASYLENAEFLLEDPAEALGRYRLKQEVVRAHLRNLFRHDYGVPRAAIRMSSLGAEFPAPGYYDFSSRTFYFNPLEETYDARQMDWLFLHEATPGHHFQALADGVSGACESTIPDQIHYAFVEGWAAYVETLGEQLGLYRTPGEKLAAIEWDLVRSARVAIDIGLNYYGWSDGEALAFWMASVPGQDGIAMREINRMRDWPVQVITYKYGAEFFARLRREYAGHKGPNYDIRDFHDIVLRYGDMPLQAFERLIRLKLGAG